MAMNKLIKMTVQNRWIMVSLFVLIGFIGYYSWEQLAIDAYPDISDVTVLVVTQVPGLAAEEVEQQIAIPLERALNGLPGLVTMRSRNSFGISCITLVFEDGVDDYWARQRVQERIGDVELPFGASPGLNPLTSPTGEIFRYVIESNNHDLRELTDLNKWIIIPGLKQVTGVADVSNFGGITTQFQIELNPLKLEEYGLSLSDVIEKIEKNNENAGGSMIDHGDLSYVIRGIGLIQNLKDLGKIVVKTEKGVPIFLCDLGKLKYGTLERKGVLGFTDKKNDHSESIEGIVQMLRGQNPSDVLKGIHKRIDELNNSELPNGVKIRPFIDRTFLVDNTLNTVSHTLLFGMILVLFILILFLGSWRGALIVAITIPLALLISFILMHLTNIPANLLSLGAIDFGIIIDASIIMMETILKKRESAPELELEKKSVIERASEVAKPILFSTSIIVAAYIPLFAFERIEKKLFTPMAFTVGYALIGALLVALFLIPGLSYVIYRKPQKIFKNKIVEKLTIIFTKQTEKILQKPKKVFIPLSLIVLMSVILSFTVGKDFLPNLDEGSLWLQVQLPPGITLDKAKEMSDSLRKHIIKYDEITYVMTQIGRDDAGTEPFSKSHMECSIGLKPYKEWKDGKRKNDLIAELKNDIQNLPGYKVSFSQPIIDMVMDQMAGTHSDLAIKIYGEDNNESRRITEDVKKAIEKIPGAEDLLIDQEPPMPQLVIHADRDKIAMYGLNVSDVAELIEVALGGKAISQLFIENKVYDITCRYQYDCRNTPDKIGNLMLTSSTGAKIPLSQIADVKLTTGASSITREMNKRYIVLSVNLRGIDLNKFLKIAKNKIEKEVSYDHEKYKIEWGGQFENQNRAYNRLTLIIPLALAIIFLLLFGAFGKLRQAAILMGIIPLALFGGMLALNIRGMTLNVSSAVGFIALFGVSIQNGVIIFSRINKLREKGIPLKDAVIMGAKQRFRPAIMTATVAVVGLFPASISTNIGSDVQRPLATVIVYGLLFATVFSLYLLPTLYYLIENKWGKENQNEK
jgi:heavy metal efflux system protein